MMDFLKLTMHETTFTLEPAPEEEHPFCFAHDDPKVQQACIGHLRGDFGSTGGLFYTTWFDRNAEANTPTFKNELDNIVNGLRKNGLLADRKTMNARCARFPDALIKTQWRNEMAFRIETRGYLYFLRCIPDKNDYNFYIFCYDRTALIEVLRQQKGLPLVSWSKLKTSDKVVAIKYGESGYYKWDTSGYENIPPEQIVDDLNEIGGISKAQAAAMEAGSMFGWHCPAADARNYDNDGRFLTEKIDSRSREEAR